MTDERKPCPFCGSKKIKMINFPSGHETWYYVECFTCSADGPIKFVRREAWDAWNKRIEMPVNADKDS